MSARFSEKQIFAHTQAINDLQQELFSENIKFADFVSQLTDWHTITQADQFPPQLPSSQITIDQSFRDSMSQARQEIDPVIRSIRQKYHGRTPIFGLENLALIPHQGIYVWRNYVGFFETDLQSEKDQAARNVFGIDLITLKTDPAREANTYIAPRRMALTLSTRSSTAGGTPQVALDGHRSDDLLFQHLKSGPADFETEKSTILFNQFEQNIHLPLGKDYQSRYSLYQPNSPQIKTIERQIARHLVGIKPVLITTY